VDDAHDFLVTRHAMRSVGLAADDQEHIFRLLSALLHLADVDFDPCPKSDGEGCAVGPGCTMSVAAAAELLGCDAAALLKAVTTRTRMTPDGPIVSPLPAKAAADTRDALSKVCRFGWVGGRLWCLVWLRCDLGIWLCRSSSFDGWWEQPEPSIHACMWHACACVLNLI